MFSHPSCDLEFNRFYKLMVISEYSIVRHFEAVYYFQFGLNLAE